MSARSDAFECWQALFGELLQIDDLRWLPERAIDRIDVIDDLGSISAGRLVPERIAIVSIG